jgi:hypothetical protein
MMPSEPIELWVFVLANAFVLLVGTQLAVLSYRAYRRNGNSALRYAAGGFVMITVGTVGDLVYELGIRGTYELGGRELLLLHTVQSALVGAGLAVLFLAVTRY